MQHANLSSEVSLHPLTKQFPLSCLSAQTLNIQRPDHRVKSGSSRTSRAKLSLSLSLSPVCSAYSYGSNPGSETHSTTDISLLIVVLLGSHGWRCKCSPQSVPVWEIIRITEGILCRDYKSIGLDKSFSIIKIFKIIIINQR